MQDRTIAIVPQRTTGIARLTLHPAKPRRKHFLVDSGEAGQPPITLNGVLNMERREVGPLVVSNCVFDAARGGPFVASKAVGRSTMASASCLV